MNDTWNPPTVPPPPPAKMATWKKIALGVGALLIVSAAYSAGQNDGQPDDATIPPAAVQTTPYRPTPTTSTTDHVDECLSRSDALGSELTGILYRVETASTPSELRSAISDTRRAISKGRALVRDCGQYAPAEARELSSTLDDLEDSLDLAELYL